LLYAGYLTNDGYGIDFDQDAARKTGHLDRGTSRPRITNQSTVHFVHSGKVCHVLQVYGCLHDIGPTRAGALEDRREIPHDPFSLDGHVALNDLAGRWIECDLARREHQVPGNYSLRVRANGGWGLVSVYGANVHGFS
jgi:hypothetical protein